VPLLKVDNLGIKFGGLEAVSGFCLEIEQGELVGLIGSNGAGKTTIFNLLTGVYAPTEGTIELCNEKIQGLKPYEITRKNIARTFQNIRLFKNMTVLENVKISYNYQVNYNFIDTVFRLPKYFKEEKEIEDKALQILSELELLDKKDELSSNLPYGKQRRVEIARALAAKPKLLLLDEPAAGMNPKETKELMELIVWIRNEHNISILLIEHDMKLVMGICEKIAVVDYGKKIAEGTPNEIKINQAVIKAYLGEDDINVNTERA
jgi:branched-chain amino acid transport system ATP-binding protein